MERFGWLVGGVELIPSTPELTCEHGRKSCRTGNLFMYNIPAKNLKISLCTTQCWDSVYLCIHTLLAGQPSYEMEQLVLYESQSPASATEGFRTNDQSPNC